MSIRVLYFAALAEQVGCRSEELDREAATAGELVDALRSRGEPWSSAFGNRIRIAINQQLAELAEASDSCLDFLLDRLRNRLGLQAIEKVGCRDEHLPEFAVHVGSDRPGGEPGDGRPCAQRPFWLMPQPQPLRQSRQQLYWNGPLSLLQGPERIEDNWWQEAVSRDYYVAADRGGQQYWVFHDRLARCWYIHGVFA